MAVALASRFRKARGSKSPREAEPVYMRMERGERPWNLPERPYKALKRLVRPLRALQGPSGKALKGLIGP